MKKSTRWIIVSLLAYAGITACADERLTVSEDATGTWARIIDANGHTIIGRIDFGKSEVIRPEALVTELGNGGTTSQIQLTANGFRQSDNCPLGSITFNTSITTGGGITGTRADNWHITGFYSSGYIGSDGRCLSR